MTRKDYVLIAEAMREARLWIADQTPNAVAAWMIAVKALATALHRDNPRFDRERFYAACGL